MPSIDAKNPSGPELPRGRDDEQLRLALVELGRIEREIRDLEPRVREPQDQEFLSALRRCRTALLKLAFGRLIDGSTFG